MQLNKILPRLFLIITGLFPILPFKIKGIVGLFFIVIVLFSLKKRKLEINYLFLLNASLFVLYFISLTYSDNFKEGISKLETTLSLFIFPIGFLLLIANKKAINNIVEYGNIFKYTFIASSFLLSILIFMLSFNYGDYITQKVNINRFVYDLSEGFLWMKDHPIYLSIYLSISLFLIAELFNHD